MAEKKKRTTANTTGNKDLVPAMTHDEAKAAIQDIVGMKTENKVKTTGRGGTANFAQAQDDTTPEDRAVALTEVLRWTKLPRVVTDEECEERVDMYFASCEARGVKPVWEELALALGCYDRTQLWRWQQGIGCSVARSNIIKMANAIMASYDARLAVNGKINPVPYIFRAKNYYGMKDEQEVVLTPNNPLGNVDNPNDIAHKYEQLPEE